MSGFRHKAVVVSVLAAFSLSGAVNTAGGQHPLAAVPDTIVVNGGVPFYSDGGSTYPGDVLRGWGSFFDGLGNLGRGTGEFLKDWGLYENLHQNARDMYRENRMAEFAARRQLDQQAKQDFKDRKRERRYANAGRLLDRLRDRPSLGSVQSGETLNFLIDELGAGMADLDFSTLPVTDEQLAGVRLKTATGLRPHDMASVLNPDGRVNWPQVLSKHQFRVRREAIEGSLKTALQSLQHNRSAAPQLASIELELTRFERFVGPWFTKRGPYADGTRNWTEATEFLRALRTVVAALRTGEAAQLFDGTLTVQPDTAEELVRHVVDHNLRFAPADPTATRAYLELHEVLAAAHRAEGRTVAVARK